jgi:hypothetical protein
MTQRGLAMKSGFFLVCACLFAPAWAQQATVSDHIAAGNRILWEAQTRAMEQCSTSRVVVTLPKIGSGDKQETLDAVLTFEWTGGCAEGKRDGAGVLTWHTERPSVGANGPTTFKITTAAEGRFVKGKRLGMWCITRAQSAFGGAPPNLHPTGLGCALMEGNQKPVSSLYLKQQDGRWQENLVGASGGTFLAAGELEAQSARMLADAAAGKSDLKAQLVVQSRGLDDLVRGSKIVVSLSPTPIPLTDKRIAVVLSSQAVRELEKFKRERQALIDASAGLRGQAAAERAKFIQASNPDRLLGNVFKVAKKQARDVQPADDLASLQQGAFDYALVLDWKANTRLDLLGRYRKEDWPQARGSVSGLTCQSTSAFLVTRELKAVRQIPAFSECYPVTPSATGDEAYMWLLAAAFARAWGDGPDDTGLTGGTLEWFFKY